MKIAIFSDTHFGFGGFWKDTKEDSFIQANEVVEKILSIPEIDAVIVPGDIFDVDNPDSTTLGKAFVILSKLKSRSYGSVVKNFEDFEYKPMERPEDSGGDGDANALQAAAGLDLAAEAKRMPPIIGIPATHERKAVGEMNIIKVLQIAGVMIDAGNKWVTLSKKTGGREEIVNILAIAGMDDSYFSDFLKKNRERIETEAAKRTGYKIFVFHQSLNDLMGFPNSFARLDDLPKGFDFYLCGHIHKKIEARVHGKPFIIPGSTVLTQQKKEEEGKKGFIIYDTETNSYQFIKIDSRDFFYVEVNLRDATPSSAIEEIRKTLEEFGAKEWSRKPIVKVKVKGTLKEGFKPKDINLSALEVPSSILVSIDKEIEDSSVDAKAIEAREKIKSGNVQIIGVELLKEHLKKSGFEMDPVHLFNLLTAKDESRKSKEKIKKDSVESVMEYIKAYEAKELSEVEKKIRDKFDSKGK